MPRPELFGKPVAKSPGLDRDWRQKIGGEIMEADEGKVMTSTKWKPPNSYNTAGQGRPAHGLILFLGG